MDRRWSLIGSRDAVFPLDHAKFLEFLQDRRASKLASSRFHLLHVRSGKIGVQTTALERVVCFWQSAQNGQTNVIRIEKTKALWRSWSLGARRQSCKKARGMQTKKDDMNHFQFGRKALSRCRSEAQRRCAFGVRMKTGFGRVAAEGRICVRRYDQLLPDQTGKKL